jgi:hypothetical protein
MAVLQGTGTTVTFATSSFTGNYISIDLPDETRESIDASTLASTDWMEFVAASLADAGSVTLNLDYDPDPANLPPITGAAESVEIAFVSISKKITFNAFVTGFNGGNLTFNQRTEASVELKITGAPVVAAIA